MTYTSKFQKYLGSNISDEAKIKLIKNYPHLISNETFKNSLKVRQSIAKNLTKIPQALKTSYETLLYDKSYLTIELALLNLWKNFPDD